MMTTLEFHFVLWVLRRQSLAGTNMDYDKALHQSAITYVVALAHANEWFVFDSSAACANTSDGHLAV